MPFATTWMDLEITMLSQRQIYDITYIWNLKKMIEMNLFTNRNRFKDLASELIFTKGESGGEKGKIRSLGLTDTYYHL